MSANMATLKISGRKRQTNTVTIEAWCWQESKPQVLDRQMVLHTHTRTHTEPDLWWGVTSGPTKMRSHNRGLHWGVFSCLFTSLGMHADYLYMNFDCTSVTNCMGGGELFCEQVRHCKATFRKLASVKGGADRQETLGRQNEAGCRKRTWMTCRILTIRGAAVRQSCKDNDRFVIYSS